MNKFSFRILLALLVASILVLLAVPSKVGLFQTAASAQSAPAPEVTAAKAQIFGPDITGELQLRQVSNQYVTVNVALRGDPQVLTPGFHGIHIHEKSVCQQNVEPRFGTAGGHFDPGPFGSSTPVEANHPFHLGDLPNIGINNKGEGRLKTISSRFTLSRGPVSLFDKDGSAIIVHKMTDKRIAGATAEDSGGARLACGVIKVD